MIYISTLKASTAQPHLHLKNEKYHSSKKRRKIANNQIRREVSIPVKHLEEKGLE